MNYNFYYATVKALGTGSFSCGKEPGWINIEESKAGYFVIWTSGEHHHIPTLNLPAVSINYKPTGPFNFYKSVLTMWPVRDTQEQQIYLEFLNKKITAAYNNQTTFVHEQYQQKSIKKHISAVFMVILLILVLI